MLVSLATRRCASLQRVLPTIAGLPVYASRALSTQPTSTPTSPPSTSSRTIRPRWPRESYSPLRSNEIWGAIQDTTKSILGSKSPEELWQSREGTVVAKLPKPQGPYDGRSAWAPQGDVAFAFSRINRTIMTNRVVPELRRHARHERAGAKRNRLTSERWRRRFAHEVRMKVKLVQEIRARGA